MKKEKKTYFPKRRNQFLENSWIDSFGDLAKGEKNVQRCAYAYFDGAWSEIDRAAVDFAKPTRS